MDILTYIDRVKANYSKQPEPVYNTKKYFMGGSVTTPKRGLVDEPGSYGGKIPFTTKQQKIAEAYVEARGMTIEDLTASQRSDIRKGMYTLETASETLSEKNKRGGENRVLKALKESQAINPKTKKVYTPEEWLNLTYSKRTAEKAKALDPVKNKERLARNKKKTYLNNREKILESRKDYYYDRGGKEKARALETKKFQTGNLEGKGGFLRDEQNRLLKYMQVAADKGNKNYKIYKEDEKFAGVKDIKKNKLYRDHRYKGTKGIPITKHPNHEEVQYFLKQARRFKIERPNQTLGSYFSKYGKTPTYSEIYSFLKLGDRASDQTRKQNRLELHHRRTIAVSPTNNLQLALFDDNSGANKIINNYNNSDSKFYKNKNYADKELKKLNINLKIPGTQSFIGSEVMSPEKSLGVAKRKTVNLLKKEIEKDPKVIERLIASIGCPNNKAMGGRAEFNTGTTCFLKGQKAINSGKIAKGAQARNFAKFANRAYKLGRGIMKFGVIPEALFVSADSLFRMGMGDTLDESLLRAVEYYVPGNQTRKADISKIKRGLGFEASKVFENVENWKDKNNELESLKQSREADLALAGTDFAETGSGVSAEDINKMYDKKEKDKEKEVLDASVSASADNQVLSSRYADEAYDISRAGSKSSMARSVVAEDESGLNRDLIAPERDQKNLNKRTSPINFMQTNLYTEEDLFKTANQLFQISGDMKKAQKYYDEGLKEIKKNKTQPLSKIVLDNPNSGVEEQVYGASGPDSFLRKINQPRPYERKATYRPNPFSDTSEQSDIYDMGRQGAATGGIASLTKTVAPKKGPESEGLAYFMKRGKK